MASTQAARLIRRTKFESLASQQHGVLHRRQLYAAGATRFVVQAEVRAGRWALRGRQTVAVHTGPLPVQAKLYRAVFETGGDAALDGVSALIARGLRNFAPSATHVSVSKGARYRRSRGVRVHETRRRRPEDVMDRGLPTVHPEVAAIRGALWADSPRQAVLLLLMAVQQRLTSVERLEAAFVYIRRDRRRGLIQRTLADMRSGVQAIGELDFAAACRRRGLPSPSRQVLRDLPNGRAYLDVYWDEFGVVVEIEGVQHTLAEGVLSDSLRQNQLTVDNDRVLRIPVLGLRIADDAFLDQVEALLRAAGWQGPPAIAS